VVLARRQRSLLTANPQWTRLLTERASISASYAYTAVNYSSISGIGLTDYRDQSGTVGFQYNLTERDALNFTGYYDQYDTKPSTIQARNFGVQGQVDHDFSERLHGALAAGWRKTKSTLESHALVCNGPVILGICFGSLTELAFVTKESSSGYTLNAFLEQRSETTTLNGRLSREINPSGAGSLIQTDRVQATWSERWTPKLSASVDAAAYRSRYIGGLITSSNGRYYRVEPRLTWRITEEWSLDGGYVYARQKYDSVPISAAANVVYVVLSYRWPKISVSR